MGESIVLDAPPLPYYLGAGRADYNAGDAHPNRRNLGLYDWIFVVKGELYIGENGRQWTLGAGETLLLLPDGEHAATKPCEEETVFYWVHFDHTAASANRCEYPDEAACLLPAYKPFVNPYRIQLPKWSRQADPQPLIDLMAQLLSPQIEGSFWEEQRLFAELLAMLADERHAGADSPAMRVAERAAAYIQRHYRSDVTNESLAAALHFHPNYVARCMKDKFGCTPMAYLHKYRLERAKRLLITTGWSIARIAEATGFRHTPYFSACFKRSVGVPPLKFRKMYIT